jgi:hypothetical protein
MLLGHSRNDDTWVVLEEGFVEPDEVRVPTEDGEVVLAEGGGGRLRVAITSIQSSIPPSEGRVNGKGEKREGRSHDVPSFGQCKPYVAPPG